MSDQLSLFGSDGPGAPEPHAADLALAERHARGAALAGRLPETVYFGTSSWTFPGWTGLVFPSALAASALGREGLRHYARHPLLRTVGVDRSYYAPVPLTDLRAYADVLPDGFRCCVKAPASVTSRVEPTFGAPRGAARWNPHFLSVNRLIDDLLLPLSAGFAAHTGPILLEFPPGPRDSPLGGPEFLERLDRFLEALPREFEYAVELRERAWLTADYREVLARHQMAHVFNYWSAMPMPLAQARVVPPDEAPFAVVRLLLKPGTWYEDQRERFRPFDRVVAQDDDMRSEVVELTARALAKGRRVYVLVNNKAEGSSPLTVEALAERLAEVWDAGRPAD
jgi:uncharacterized protein YecE (DUF72 family)